MKITLRRVASALLVSASVISASAAELPPPPRSPAPTQWRGLRVGVLGDSITDKRQSHSIYWQHLSRWLDWDVRVYGISGHTWAQIPGQADKMAAEMGDDVDAVFVFIGTNDYAHGDPLGDWWDYEIAPVNWWGTETNRVHRTPSRDLATVRGRANVALEKIKKRWPLAQVVLLTPTKRAFFTCSPTNVQPGEDWPNTLGLYLDSYVEATREAGRIWSCPVIDLNAESGLVPLLDGYSQFFRNPEKDGLHPNGDGHLRIADLIYARLVALPCGVSARAGRREPPLASPDGGVSAQVAVGADGALGIAVSLDGRVVVERSALGVTVGGRDLGKNVALGRRAVRTFRESYPWKGNKSTVVNSFRECAWPVLDMATGAELMKLEVRAFDDAVAYRYVLPSAAPREISGEASSWKLPAGTKIWFQDDMRSYENPYSAAALADVKPGTPMAFPITAKLDAGGYLLLTEANLVNYSDLGAKKGADGEIGVYFHADKKGAFTQEGAGETPWRVTIVARDLNALANSDAVKNLCPPCTNAASAALETPGRAIWQWLPAGDPVYAEQKDWLDRTKALGFEYYLIDDGWKTWRDGDLDQWACLAKVISYGNLIGVKSAIWVNSKEMQDAESRRAYLKRVKETGAVGIKIDFIPASNYKWTQWYEDTLADTAAAGLFVDFHGAVKPSGRERTWPHELAREAVRGHEYHITRYQRVQSPDHDTILPFCRLVQGRADYTPVVFEKKELVRFTWARELAQGVVFSAPFLCFGDYPKNYQESPMADVLKSLPATYDETRVLDGSEIGEMAAFAKRKGDTWYVAALNADKPRSLEIDLAFLGAGEWDVTAFSDVPDALDQVTRNACTVTAAEKFSVNLRPCGGFCATLTKKAK